MRIIKPKFVLVDEELCSVSDFAHLKTSERPDAVCPGCKNKVTMKLGQKNVHHYSHMSDVSCSLNNPETAMHFNVKYHIYKSLLNSRSVDVLERCAGCRKTQEVKWLDGWDNIEVEYRMKSKVPDIALLKNDEVIGVIEIAVTHKMDIDKMIHLNDSGIKWIEIEVNEDNYDDIMKWNTDLPLPYHSSNLETEILCEPCHYRRNNYTEIISFKIVDFYYETGKHYREIFYVKEEISQGKLKAVRLETDSKSEILCEFDRPRDDEMSRTILQVFKRYLNRFSPTTIIDSPWKWLNANNYPGIQNSSTHDHFFLYPQRYISPWWDTKQAWYLPEKYRKSNIK